MVHPIFCGQRSSVSDGAGMTFVDTGNEVGCVLFLMLAFFRNIWLRRYNFCFCLPFNKMEGSKIFLSCPVKTGVSLTAFLDSIFSISTDTSMERSNESARTEKVWSNIQFNVLCRE